MAPRRPLRRLRPRLICAAAVVCALAGWQPARAQAPEAQPQVCVTCEDPSASYVCAAPAGLGISGGLARKAFRFTCLKEIARLKGHAICSVRRDVQGPCLGETVVLTQDAPAAVGTAPAAPEPAPTQAEPPPARDAEGPPRTMVEAVERAGEESTRQFKDASDTVSSFVRQSWTCVSSLFSDCKAR